MTGKQSEASEDCFMRHRIWALCLIGLLGITSPLQAAPIDPHLIQPGVGIGHIRLTAYSDRNFFGEIGLKPTQGDAAMGGRMDYTWTGTSPGPGKPPNTVLVYTRQDGAGTVQRTHLIHVKSIRVTSSYFRTLSGVGSGSTLATIRRSFPHAQRNTKLLPDKVEYADITHGISFEFAQAPHSSQARCIAVWVFPIGQTYVYN